VNSQQSLFRASDPETSHRALTIEESHSAELAVLGVLPARTEGEGAGLTADEICDLLPGWHPPTIKSALARLHKMGRVWDTQQRRPSNQGRLMIAWSSPYP
jgi:hypothetical protein